MMQAVRRNNENAPVGKPFVNQGGLRKPLGVSNVSTKIPFRENRVGSLKEPMLKPAKSFKSARCVSVNEVPKNQVGFKSTLKSTKSLKAAHPEEAKKEVFEKIVPDIHASLPVVPESHLAVQIPADVDNIDSEDGDNPQLVSIYINEIYQYLRSLEALFPIKKYHLSFQPEITGKMRSVLIDWLIQVHQKFHMLQETLYMTVSIIDRYLQAEAVKRSELQLVGVTAMFIASKFEEMYAPEIGDFVYITDNAYTKAAILKQEQLVLKKLDFHLGKPLPLHFLRRNSKAGDVDATMHTLAKYLMEVVLVEYELAHHPPSLVAAASLYVSVKVLGQQEWTNTLKFYSNYNEKQILPLAKSICRLVLRATSSKHQAVHSKYATSKLLKVSQMPELKCSIVKNLAELELSEM